MSKITTIWTYQLNNVQTEFAVNFDYLSRKFVQVTLIGKDRKVLRMNVDYRFIGPKTIKTNKPWGSNDGYQYLEIRRVTSATDSIVDFSDGSILRAGDLTIANLQSMHIAEEARNLAGDALGVNDDGQLDARARRIVNLGNPVGRLDAVNKAYVDDAKDSVIDSRNKALQYRNEAQRFRDEAEGFKNTASSKASEISSKIAKADSLNNQAITNSTKAQQYAGDAQRSASAASTSEKNAKASDKSAAASAASAKADADRVNPDLLVKKTGDTMTGALKLPSLTVTSTSNRNTTILETSDKTHVEIVVDNTQYNGEKAFFRFRDPQGVGKDVCFPKSAYSDSGDIHLATKEETISKSGDTMTGELIIKKTNFASVGLESTSVSKRWFVSNESGTLSFYRCKAPYSDTEFVVNCPDKGGTIALEKDTLPRFRVSGSSFNFDTATTEGYYQISGRTTGTGAPSPLEGHMFVITYGDGNIEQRVTQWNSGIIYVRSARYLSGVSWKKYEIPRVSSYSTLDLNEESDEGISLYQEVEDLKAQVAELRALLNVAN